MAWQVSKRVWDSTRIRDKKEDKDKFKPAHRLVLLALADIADENGICWPKFDTSYQTLADMAGIERRSAIRVIDDLIKAGHLFKNDTVGRGHSNIYVVVIGLSEPEKEKVLALISDLGVTISNEEQKEEQKEMVTWESPASDLGVTISGLNGDRGVTHPILGNPSLPTKELPKGNGATPQQPDLIPEAEGIPEENLLPDTPETLYLFEKINHNRKLKNRGPMKEFKSCEQKEKCLAAMGRLPPKELEESITKGLEKGLTDISSLINWMAKWELPKNGKDSKSYGRKATQGNHGTSQARAPVSATGLGEWTEDEKREYGFT